MTPAQGAIGRDGLHSIRTRPTGEGRSALREGPMNTPWKQHAVAAALAVPPLASGALIPAGLPAAVRPQAGAIAAAAHRLVTLRDAWLNPPEWTERIPEVVPLGLERSPYPDRIVAKAGFEADVAKRTLTNLYNQRPARLAQAHAALDAAVAAAYGWTDWTPDMPDDEILRRLLALNRARAGAA